MSLAVLDSYSETNQDTTSTIQGVHPSGDGDVSARGQTIEVRHRANVIQCRFYLRKVGNPVGNLRGVLATLAGTHGTDGEADVDLIETPNVAMAGIGAAFSLVTFTFAGRDTLPGTYGVYIYAHDATLLNAANCIEYGFDSSASTHAGNAFYWNFGVWQTNNFDTCFYISGYLLSCKMGYPPIILFIMSSTVKELTENYKRYKTQIMCNII